MKLNLMISEFCSSLEELALELGRCLCCPIRIITLQCSSFISACPKAKLKPILLLLVYELNKFCFHGCASHNLLKCYENTCNVIVIFVLGFVNYLYMVLVFIYICFLIPPISIIR